MKILVLYITNFDYGLRNYKGIPHVFYINVIKQNLVSLLLGGLATFRGGGGGSILSDFRDLLEATEFCVTFGGSLLSELYGMLWGIQPLEMFCVSGPLLCRCCLVKSSTQKKE